MTVPSGSAPWAIVDFNGVLGLHPDDSQWAALAQAADWRGSITELQTAFWHHRDAYDAGRITARQFWEPLTAGRKVRVEDTAAVDAAMWLGVDPHVLAVLERVADTRVLRLAMLSNAPAPVADLIEAAPWSGIFTEMVFSCRIGVNKPRTAAYRAALQVMGDPDPTHVVMVDDRLDNILAAQRVGLTAHHYRQDHQQLHESLEHHAGSVTAQTRLLATQAPR